MKLSVFNRDGETQSETKFINRLKIEVRRKLNNVMGCNRFYNAVVMKISRQLHMNKR